MDDTERLAAAIEHTALSPLASRADIERLVREASEYSLFGVCVSSVRVQDARAAIARADRSITLVTVVGFPNGAVVTELAVAEAHRAVDDGADELDIVAPLGWFRDGERDRVRNHLAAVVEAADGRPLKVILETGLLDDLAICDLGGLAVEAGAKFLKTSTGIPERGGATPAHVALLRAIGASRAEVKASGGIRTREAALRLLDAGATRIGTSLGPRLVSPPDLT